MKKLTSGEEEVKKCQQVCDGKNFTVIDIETTGFSPMKGGFLLELAGVKVRNGKITGRFSELINTGYKVPKKTTELTGITNEMVEGKPRYPEVLERFLSFIGDDVVMAHNAMFDWGRFILYYSQKIGIKLTNDSLCTKKMFKGVHSELKSFGLSDLCNQYGISLENHHRALDDTEATALAFLAMQDEIHAIKFEVPNEPPKETKAPLTQANLNPIKVTRATYWEKQIGKKPKMQRVYVGITRDFRWFATVFYDIPSGRWFNKDYEGDTLDFKDIEKKALQKLNVKTFDELMEEVIKNQNSRTSVI